MSIFIGELVGTAVLVLLGDGVVANVSLARSKAHNGGWIVVAAGWGFGVAIGLSLGGPTGYAINPARDLAPRLVHALLPIAGKGGSNWGYAWIPVVGPIVGGVIGALVYTFLFTGLTPLPTT